jgi:hypothetical protein
LWDALLSGLMLPMAGRLRLRLKAPRWHADSSSSMVRAISPFADGLETIWLHPRIIVELV